MKINKKFIASATSAALVASAIVPVASAASFSDIENNTHKDAILALAEAGIISGYTDGTFKPNAQVTRGNVTKLLGKWLVSEGYDIPADYNTVERFTDVPVTHADQELVKYAALVKDAGVFNGSNGKLMQANNMSREQMAVVLVRAIKTVYGIDLIADYKAANFESSITDFDQAIADYHESITALEFAGLTTQKTFNPKGTVTRGQFASFLNRAIEYAAKQEVAETVEVESVTAVNGTITVTLKEKAEKVDVKDFTVTQAINGGEAKEVTPSKAVLAEDGKTVTLTVEEVAQTDAEQSVVYTVNKVTAEAFAVEAVKVGLKVESVTAINATQVEVKFNKAVEEADAITTSPYKVTVTGVTFTGTPVLSEDGKTLTLTADAPIEVTNAAVVVEPIKSKDDSLESSKRYASLLTYEDTVAPDITSVEAKTASSSASSVTVTFSEPIKSVGTVKINGVAKVPTGFKAGDTTATFTGLDLDASKSHNVQFVGLTDQAGNKLTNKTIDFTVTKDVTAPTVTLSASTDKDNVIVVEFDKAVTVASAKAALVNGIVKGETLEAVTSGTATPVDAVNGTAKKFEIAVTTPFTSKTTRDLTVIIPAGIKDALGNEVVATTKTVKLTKDVVAPLISSVKVVKDNDGKVTDLVLVVDSTLAQKSQVIASTLKSSLTVVDSEGVLVDSSTWLGGVSQDAITAGDKEITLSFATPAKVTGKYTITFAAGLATDEATTPNNLQSKTVVVDFGTASTTDTFEIAESAVSSGGTNIYKVNFGGVVKGGAVAGSATDVANYTLNGAALPEGTTITLDAGKTTATITLPASSIATSDAKAVFTIENVQRATGEVIVPLTTTVAIVDNTAPLFTAAAINADGTVSLTFSEAVVSSSGSIADFTFAVNNKAVTVGNGNVSVADGSGADAGKYVFTFKTSVDTTNETSNGVSNDATATVYFDVDGDGSYSSTVDILIQTYTGLADSDLSDYTSTTYNVSKFSSLVIGSIVTPTVVKDTSANQNVLKGDQVITVK